MSRHRQDYQDIAHLPLPERLAHIRALFLRDRLGGLQHPFEDYVRHVPEGERPLFLEELREALCHIDEGATSGSAPSGHDAGSSPGLIGRYQLQKVLGKGAFGEVWRAFDPELQGAVAVKFLRSDRQWSDNQVAMVLDEGRKLARLKHPGIVAVYDVGRTGDGLFIVSELIEGGTLGQRMARAKVARQDIPALLAEIADAAHQAHLHGLIHRDIKPANVLMDSQHRPHLVDFGVALAEEDQRGAKGSIAGTVAYMSPEQVRGESHLLDGRTDVYSIGVIMYELLTGRRPFRCTTREEYREQILLRQPRPPRSIDDSIPRVLEEICLKCLAKAVAERYTTAADLAAALRQVAADAPESTATIKTGAPNRHRAWVAAGVGVLLLAACLALIMSGRLWPGGGASPDPRPPAGTPDAGKTSKPPGTANDPNELRIKELVWPGKWPNDPSTWQASKATGSLNVNASSRSLLQLADLSRDDFEVSVQIRQVNSDGRIGVFFGLREDQKQGIATYQLLQVMLCEGTHCLQRIVNTYRLDSPLEHGAGLTVGSAKVAYSSSRYYPFALRVRGGRLEQVTFDGKPVTGLTSAFTAKYDCRGAFGVYNLKSTGDFSRVVIDDALKRFADDRGH